MTPFLIGDLSREAGCNAQTIRWYEAEGLLPPPLRTEGNQRRYGAEHVARLAFIRHAREFGFSLDAIRELLALADEPKRPCAEADAIARRHLGEVERRIRQLSRLRAELKRMVESCSRGRISTCRVIEVLGDHSHARCLDREHPGDAVAAPAPRRRRSRR